MSTGTLLQDTIARIRAPDAAIAAEVQRRLDVKTKPLGSLGRLEEVARTFAAIRGTPDVEMPRKAVVVMAADHGVAEEGVSAFPQAVTAQMVANFASGGAAINVLSRHADARLLVVDMGVKEPVPSLPGVLVARVAAGTANLARGPAMTRAQAIQGLETGIAIAQELADEGRTLVAIGEMGIANTTAASALTAALTGLAPEEVTGRGTGIDDPTWTRKVAVVRRALEVNGPFTDALDTLARLGGFEIAGLAGVVLGAAARSIAVVSDGFIATSAAVAATRIAPAAAGSVLASHRSVEAGHRALLAALGTRPLLDLDLRLGEGTGAALAMPLVDAAVRVLREMASFESAGVSGKVR